jgi:hypothetical protein
MDLEAEWVLKDDIHGLIKQQKLKWKQRAKEDRLCHGDQKTNVHCNGSVEILCRQLWTAVGGVVAHK